VGTPTITMNINDTLIRTHFQLIKKSNFLWLKKISFKGESDYDKRYSNWTMELSTTTKVIIVPPFDLSIKLSFHPKNIISNFGVQMLQPFTTTTNAFAITSVCGEIDGKFELLVANGTSPIGIIYIYYFVKFYYFILFNFYQNKFSHL
jgi:hypothetical protein